MCYDLQNESLINELVSDFVSEEIQSQNEMFGAVTWDIDSKFCLDVVERDYPGLDIENLISCVNCKIKQRHFYDVLLFAIRSLPKNCNDRTIVVIGKGFCNDLGAARAADILDKIDQTAFVMLSFDENLLEEIHDFVLRNNFCLINNSSEPKNMFEELRKKYFY